MGGCILEGPDDMFSECPEANCSYFFFFLEALTEEEKEKLAKIKKKMKRKVCWQVVRNTELLLRMQL